MIWSDVVQCGIFFHVAITWKSSLRDSIYSLYKYREEPRTYQRKPREEKKKPKELRTSEKPRPRATQQRTAQVVCDPGSALPRSCATQAAHCLGFFHPGACRLGHALLGFFSPRSHATQIGVAWVFFTQVASYYLRLMVGNQICSTWF